MSASFAFNRTKFLQALDTQAQWDLVIVGGGATGLGIALDSAARGYSTLLLEGADFAKGTSSRSTKLVHGGVRYLEQGDIKLVYEALHERGLLLKNAPHLVKKQAFIIPCYSPFSVVKYFAGLKLYDWLSGRLSFGKSRFLTAKEVQSHFPGLKSKGLRGGVQYFDGQFDDARLAINLAQTAVEKGAVVLNYCKVTGLQKVSGRITGVHVEDVLNKKQYNLQAKLVINATGVFVDDIMQMDSPKKAATICPSQGAHVVVDPSFLSGNQALMIPETADGRVLFAVPWHQHLLLGTTDTPLKKSTLEPVALEEEITFILNTLKQYLYNPPERKDVQAVFAGLRPLAAPQKSTGTTKEISRSHKIIESDSGLLTIIGGKWTTYRKMAEDILDKAIKKGVLPPATCTTKNISIHGASRKEEENQSSVYGTDWQNIAHLMEENPSLQKKLAPGFSYTEAEVVWAAKAEMACTLEDVLARRLRLLFLDARMAIAAAPRAATLMAESLGHTKEWEQEQVALFTALAQAYLPTAKSPDDYDSLTEVATLPINRRL